MVWRHISLLCWCVCSVEAGLRLDFNKRVLILEMHGTNIKKLIFLFLDTIKNIKYIDYTN